MLGRPFSSSSETSASPTSSSVMTRSALIFGLGRSVSAAVFTAFRQMLEELGQHPQEEGGVELRRVHQLLGGEDADHALAVLLAHQIRYLEHRLAEELRRTLALEG